MLGRFRGFSLGCCRSHNNKVVDTAFARLFESYIAAKFLIIKSLKARKRYLDELARELNLDIFNSSSNHASNATSAKVKTVSSSDEDGGDGNENEADLTA